MTREEAKQWLEAMKSSYALPTETYEALDMAIEALSADAVHGEWYQIKDHMVMGEGYMWHCSICDYKVYQDSSADYPSENFCPNCGAIMKGGAK